ncbi:uncharacterized protein LOC142886540 [Nelusetta ayraudi]|uniref:uncharacterized protein LOC142886540 n=1 Tax=Nelusetta ayraudi TaxID=303726 RepID=UPI003F71FD85
MEGGQHDNRAVGGGERGGESHPSWLTPHEEVDASQEGGAKLTPIPLNECDEDGQPSGNEAKGQGRDSEVEKPVSDQAAPPQQLTLVLIGDRDATDMESNNILLDNNWEEFSPQLYDLCGRCISVIDMLGFPNTESIQFKGGIHAFLLLVPNGLHVTHYNLGLQWLKKTFGKESFAFLMTIVTHRSSEKCENSITDLKDVGGFDEKRYHTCLRSMADGAEIVELLGKIDAMVSDNSHGCFGGIMDDKDKKWRNKKCLNKENIDSSALLCSGDEPKNSCTEECDESEDEEESLKPEVSAASEHDPESTEKGKKHIIYTAVGHEESLST